MNGRLASRRLAATEAPAHAAPHTLAEDVRAGLSRSGQKKLPPRWLYDDVGSALFEAICLMPEYGLARADSRILELHAGSMGRLAGHPGFVAELGSGSGRKSRLLLEDLARHRPLTYIPIDVSRAALTQCEAETASIPNLSVDPYEGEYLRGLSYAAAARRPGQRLLVLFLGSTIGNFDPPEAEQFLADVRRLLAAGDMLLLGTDLMKPVPDLLAAYDDPAGITAAFDLNLLARLNRELGASFDLSCFSHEARWNGEEGRIEMHLRSREAQAIDIPGARLKVRLCKGETLWTESSYKFSPDQPHQLARRTGFRVVDTWTDPEWPFCETLLRATLR